jgi:hypothetical protein
VQHASSRAFPKPPPEAKKPDFALGFDIAQQEADLAAVAT